MTDLNQLESIFFGALQKPLTERAAFLAAACGGDVDLQARVERLLAAQPNVGEFLEPAVTHTFPSPETQDCPGSDEAIGAVLAGKYKLVEAIGEGGMGQVFLAQQTEPVRRAVAVKVIKAGMDSKAVLARFEAERQALALMDHPSIARVLDAGTTDGGRPFFVMELVKGVPITQYCDDRKLTPRQRLELFVPVCQAIQHAHQKGIIHRDIKPSNVLVAMYDDRPVPKVIDFGVAKAAGQTLTDKTLMTGFGAVVGTPEYMSPEQASLNNLDVDTRSDVYSLGVLLYELLTGTTPVDRKSLGQAAVLEVLRIVREVEAPRPSAKLSTIDTLPSVAANRGTEPAKLTKLMKGELHWVLLKALEKDRSRRYESANGLARDIQRYLADEIVEARPPSIGYRFRRFVRRNRNVVLFACLIILGTLTGATVELRAANRVKQALLDEAIARSKAEDSAEGERQAKQIAEQEARKSSKQAEIAEAVKDFLEEDLIGQVNPLDFGRANNKPDPELKLKTALDRAVPHISQRFEGKPLIEASIRRAIGKAYLGRGLYPEAQTQLEKACELYRAELSRANPSEVNDLVRGPYIDALFDVFNLWNTQGQRQKALAVVQVIDEQVRAEFGDSPEGEGMLKISAGLRELLEGSEPEQGIKKAQDVLQKNMNALSPALGDQVTNSFSTVNQFTAAIKMMEQGKYVESERALLQLIESQRAKGGPEVAIWTGILAEVYRLQGRYAEARINFVASRDGVRKALGEDHPMLGVCLYGLALTLLSDKKFVEAETDGRIALAFYERRMPDDLTRFDLNSMIGAALAGQKKYPEAEAKLLAAYEGLTRQTKVPLTEVVQLPTVLDRLIELYTAMNKPDEAKKWQAERAKYREILPPPRAGK